MHFGNWSLSISVRIIFPYIYAFNIYSNYFNSYLIENEVCYLVLCERNYSKRLAYSYLEDIAQEFHSQYGKKVRIYMLSLYIILYLIYMCR